MNHEISVANDTTQTEDGESPPTETIPLHADTGDDIARLRELALANPHSAEPYHNLALVLGRAGDRDEALANFHRALEIEPLRLQARLDLASFCHETGDGVGAVRELVDTVRLVPQSAQAQRMLGNVLRDTGNFEEAIKRYKEALLLLQNGDVYFSLGVVLCQLGRIDEAAQAYRDAIALDPSISGAHNNLGTILLDRKNNLPEAIACFQQAIRSRPDCDASHRNLGIALARQGRHDDAIHAFRAALRLHADNPDTLMGLGTSLRDSGKPAESLPHFHESLRLGAVAPFPGVTRPF
jgi:tetratricopeptide (TPR) repeat protein